MSHQLIPSYHHFGQVKYIFFHRLPLLTASQDPSLGITEQIEVSKSFQTIQKTIAMHPEGWVNELVDEAMTELKAGARVYRSGAMQ